MTTKFEITCSEGINEGAGLGEHCRREARLRDIFLDEIEVMRRQVERRVNRNGPKNEEATITITQIEIAANFIKRCVVAPAHQKEKSYEVPKL